MTQKRVPSASDYEDAIELHDAIEAIEALREQGLEDLPAGLERSFSRDEYATALAIAREHYSQASSGRSRASAREASILYAVLLAYRGLNEEASGVLRGALARHPMDVPLQLAQTLNVLQSGDREVAAELLSGLGEVPTGRASWQTMMGHLHLELDRADEAIACYRRAMEGGSPQAEVAYRLARLLWERGLDRHEAAHYLEQAARLKEGDARAWTVCAEAWGEIEAWARSVQAWTRVVRLEPEDASSWLEYGRAQRAAGEFDAAARALQKAARLGDPFDMSATLELAHTRALQGFFEEALQRYGEVLKERPEELDALRGATASSFALGDLTEALRYAERALKLDDEEAEAHFDLGSVLAELGQHERAAEALERALVLEPEEALYAMRLAALRGAQGECAAGGAGGAPGDGARRHTRGSPGGGAAPRLRGV